MVKRRVDACKRRAVPSKCRTIESQLARPDTRAGSHSMDGTHRARVLHHARGLLWVVHGEGEHSNQQAR
jgi:hypothetical protein